MAERVQRFYFFFVFAIGVFEGVDGVGVGIVVWEGIGNVQGH